MIGEQAALGADGLITAKTTVASPPADPNDVKYAPMTMEQMYEAEVHEYQVLTEELKDQLRQAANVIHQLQAENTNVSNQLIIARRKVAVYDTFFKHDGPVSASVTARVQSPVLPSNSSGKENARRYDDFSHPVASTAPTCHNMGTLTRDSNTHSSNGLGTTSALQHVLADVVASRRSDVQLSPSSPSLPVAPPPHQSLQRGMNDQDDDPHKGNSTPASSNSSVVNHMNSLRLLSMQYNSNSGEDMNGSSSSGYNASSYPDPPI